MIVVRSVQDALEAFELVFLLLWVAGLPLPGILVGRKDCCVPCVVRPRVSLFKELGRTEACEVVFVGKTSPRVRLTSEQLGVHVLYSCGVT